MCFGAGVLVPFVAVFVLVGWQLFVALVRFWLLFVPLAGFGFMAGLFVVWPAGGLIDGVGGLAVCLAGWLVGCLGL